MNKSKKIAAIITSAALVVTMSIGGTLAWLTARTDTKTNAFTVTASKNISIDLKEPNWDKTGSALAKDMYPGLTIQKDPTVTNTSNKRPVWIAVKLQYTVPQNVTAKTAANTLAGINQFANIDFDANNWEFNADKTVAYYKTMVNPQALTTPVFNNVTIKSTDKENDIQNFDIQVTAYAVQGDISVQFDQTVKSELDKLMSAN